MIDQEILHRVSDDCGQVMLSAASSGDLRFAKMRSCIFAQFGFFISEGRQVVICEILN